MSAIVINATVWQASTPTLLGRIYLWDASVAQQADITALSWKSVDTKDTATLIDSGTFTVADVIYDTLQTDARWNEDITGNPIDSTGYNFAATLPATAIPNGQRTYLVTVTVDPVVGADYPGVWRLSTQSVYTPS